MQALLRSPHCGVNEADLYGRTARPCDEVENHLAYLSARVNNVYTDRILLDTGALARAARNKHAACMRLLLAHPGIDIDYGTNPCQML